MNLFLDTKFTDFKDCELISIGLVSEDGLHHFYAERSDFLLARCSDWALGNILPMLASTSSTRMDRSSLHTALWQWFEALPSPATILFDNSTDWCLLAEALLDQGQTRIPASIASTRSIAALKQETVFSDAMRRHFFISGQRHHALTEAQALRAGWLAWNWSQDVSEPVQPAAAGRQVYHP